MLIGVMTMQRVPNYGSFLQAYSLKRMIEMLGHEVVFVDYHVEPDIEHKNDAAEKLKCGIDTIAKDFKTTRAGRVAKKVLKGSAPTSRSIMFSCNSMLGITERRNYNTKCDVLVIGSDEVFNCLQLGRNVGYSLELFGKKAKANKVVSYAASFGSTTLEKLEFYDVANEIGGYLKKINALSVRDDNSLSVVKRLTGDVPLLHLDPVLVGGVEKEAWQPCNEGSFVLLYGYANRFTEAECSAALEFAHSRGLKLIAVGEEQRLCDEHVRCQPNQVLSYFNSADFVITDTFHGTIFSVISHTPFVTIPREDKNGHGGNVQKLTSLLEGVGFTERRAANAREVCEILSREMSFQSSDAIRVAERQRSLDYLKGCFC